MRTSLGLELFAHVERSLMRQVLVPAGADMDGRRKRADEISRANAIAGVVKTHARPAQSGHGASIASADIVFRGETTGDVDLFLQGHGAHELAGLLIGARPQPGTSAGC